MFYPGVTMVQLIKSYELKQLGSKVSGISWFTGYVLGRGIAVWVPIYYHVKSQLHGSQPRVT